MDMEATGYVRPELCERVYHLSATYRLAGIVQAKYDDIALFLSEEVIP